MEKLNPILKDTITLRLLKPQDLDLYYDLFFQNPDQQVNYYTATTEQFTKETIQNFLIKIEHDETRYDFLIIEDEKWLGEIVLNEIDWKARNAGFRIALFNESLTNKGIGTQAIQMLLEFAFHILHLHRIELEVFDYNPRAKRVYEKCGFQVEGIKRESLCLKGEYHDVIMMSILEADYK